jgi:hypothetical protein
VFETGAPHGDVPVAYYESSVIPKGGHILVGSQVIVEGTFNSNGTLNSSSVELITGATGPYHIPLWVNDLYGGEGSSASSVDVAKYASYAEGGLGNTKAVVDCVSGACKSVYYFDPNKLYAGSGCRFMPDSIVLSAASESWFVHQKGYTDKAHRVYGKFNQGCAGTIYEANDGNSGVQGWWRTELQSNADTFDIFFMDDTEATVVDEFYFKSGGGCLPWPSLCRTTQEVPNDATVVANHAHFVNALNHVNGQAMRFAFNSLNFDGSNVSSGVNILKASSRFIAAVCEGCAVSNGRIFYDNYQRILDTMAAVNKTQGAFVLHSTDSAAEGSGTQIFERLITVGLVWLGYSASHAVAWPDLEDATNKLAAWPEDLIVPSDPVQSMTSGSSDLQVTSGVWRREFRTCYQKSISFGRCAVVVNSNSGSRTILAGWLSQAYSHVISVSGGDILSGGTVSPNQKSFKAGTTTVPAFGAILLAE